MLAGKGDLLPVSAFPVDGTWPTGTTQWEKRTIALEIPVWDRAALHPVQQVRAHLPARRHPGQVLPGRRALAGAPATFKSMDFKSRRREGDEVHHPGGPRGLHRLRALRRDLPGRVEDRRRGTRPSTWSRMAPLRETERRNFDFFLALPDPDRTKVKLDVKGTQFLEPLFEFSGACAGCGETPYVKLLTQLFGDRAIIANATGCSSIYGGNLPTTPYTKNDDGRGPAWANSLFEDNAEFGFGMRLAVDKQAEQPRELLRAARRQGRRRPGEGAARGRPVGRGRASRPSAAGWPCCKAKLAGRGRCRGAAARADRRLPGEEERSGSSAATAGPTTSATAASTTSSPWGGT